MKIPYVSAIGEGDDESVSLANHLDCYLIAQDSDYYCYNLHRGYVPFKYVDITPIGDNSEPYLNAQLYHIDSLLNQFPGLQRSTLALACCLCGNDYINVFLMKPMFIHIITALEKSKQWKEKNDIPMKNLWNAMQWLRQFNDINSALPRLLPSIQSESERKEIENQLHSATQSYLTPADTLIYRFISENNKNLLTNSHFVQLARTYLNTLDMVIKDLRFVFVK